MSTARAFLKPVLGRPNLRLETGVLVEKVLFEGRRAVGVQFRQNGQARDGADARRGDPVRRRRRLAADPAALGRRPGRLAGRARHPGGARQARASAATCRTICSSARSSRCRAPRRSTRPTTRCCAARWMGAEYALFQKGPLTMAPSQLGIFTMSSSRARARQHRVPCAAAVARQVRRAAASLPGDHRQRLQPAADLARHDPPALGRSGRQAEDRAQLSLDAGRPPRRRRRDPRHAPPDEAAGAAALSSRGVPARAGSATTRPRSPRPRATSARRSSIPIGTAKMGLPSDPMAVVDARAARDGARAAARGRRLGDADHHLGQHQHADHHDRRQGGPR